MQVRLFGVAMLGLSLALYSATAGPLHAQAQQAQQANRGSVTGIVRDATSGAPLSQAGVVVAGTSLGAVSGADGRYTIVNVPAGIQTLQVKRIGYSPTNVPDIRVAAGAPTTQDITISEQALLITGVVTTGVSDPTSGVKAPFSVAAIGQEQLQVTALGSPIESLAGKVASLSVTAASGAPGSDMVIQIRNPLSFVGNTQPMIIIDGVIQMQDDPSINANSISGNPLDINPDLIESIEVVRGAAAAAIYGQKAANGVINITTKRGNDLALGTTRLTLSNEYGGGTLGRTLPLAQSHRFLVDGNNQFIDTFGRPVEGRNYVTDPDQVVDNAWGVPTYNNYKALFKTGQTILNNLNLSQSNLGTNFSISAGASQETGVVRTPDGGIGRQNMGMNLDHRAGSLLTGSIGLYYNRQFQRYIASGNNIFSAARDIARDIDITKLDPLTNDYIPFPDGVNDDRFNPLYFEPRRDEWEKRIGVQANSSVTLRPSSILSFNLSGGYGRSDREGQQQYVPAGELTDDGDADPGQYDISADLDETFNTAANANVLVGMGGLTFRTRLTVTGAVDKRHGFAVRGDSLFQSGPDLDFTRRYAADETKRDVRSLGITGNVAFDYNAKYIADLVYRRDGNSLLPKASRWNGNGRASFAWSMSEENWWPLADFSLFKPRYSIGTAGNNPPFTAQYETYLRNAGTERVFKQNMGNVEIAPEEVTEQEFGLDMSFRNKYSVSLTYVRNVVKNAIRADTISSYTGFDTQQKNLGDMQGDTYEATIESQWINTRNFRWSSTLVLDRSRQKITNYPRRCQNPNTTTVLNRECEGYVFGQMYGFELIRDKANLNPLHVESGELHQFDINDDGLVVAVGEVTDGVGGSWTDMRWGETVSIDGINYAWGLPLRTGVYNVSGVRTGNASNIIGQGLPDVSIGFGNQITLGRWSGHMQLVGQLGGKIFNREAMNRVNLEIHEMIDQTGKAEYTKKPISYYRNSVTTSSGAGGLTANGSSAVDWFLEDADYIKVSELRIAYRLDNGLPLLNSLGMTSGSVAIAARNLFTITDYSGIDPQVSGSTSATSARVDEQSYPRYRSVTAALRLIF